MRTGWTRALGGIVALGLAGSAAAAAGGDVRVSVTAPAPGGKLRDYLHQARVEGSALAENGGPERFDVMLVIDVSESTKAASGADVDRDGSVGVEPANELLPPGAYPPEVVRTDPQDTVLHARDPGGAHAAPEPRPAARARRPHLLRGRGRPDHAPAPAHRPAGRLARRAAHRRLRACDRALTRVLARGARGATNFAAAVRLVITELAGLGGAAQRAARRRQQGVACS